MAKFEMWRLYARLFDHIRQSKNRIQLIVPCKWALRILTVFVVLKGGKYLLRYIFTLETVEKKNIKFWPVENEHTKY
jgi:hypothetical protein